MKTIPTLVAATLTVVSLSAQIRARATAATDLVVAVSVDGWPLERTIPAGEDLSAGARIVADGAQDDLLGAHASTTLALTGGRSLLFLFDNRASFDHAGHHEMASARAGRHDVLLSLWSERVVHGTLRLSAEVGGDDHGGRFDIGADGSYEFIVRADADGTETWEMPFVLTPRVVEIRMQAVAGVQLPGGFGAEYQARAVLRVEFMPNGAARSGKMTKWHPPCGASIDGLLHTWTDAADGRSYQTVALRGRSDQAPAHALFVLGFDEVVIPLPTGGCTLRTDLVLPVWVTPEPGGEARFEVAVPWPTEGLTVFAQYVVIAAAHSGSPFWSSELLRIDLP